MTSTNDLRAMLERHAGAAPDGHGMIEAAQAGAVRVRRRRKITATVAAAVVVAVIAIGLPVARHLDSAPPPPAGVVPRTPTPVTVDMGLAPGSGFVVTGSASAPGYRMLRVQRDRSDSPEWLVRIFEPGALDPADLPAGSTVRVGGHDARLIGATRSGDGGTHPALAWETTAGSWIVIDMGELDTAPLLAIGAALQPRPAATIAGVLQLTWVPADLSVLMVETLPPGLGPFERITFVAPGGPDPQAPGPFRINGGGPGFGDPAANQMQITVSALGPGHEYEITPLGDPTATILGSPAWYSAGSAGAMAYDENSSRYFVRTGTCLVRVELADRTLVSEPDLTRMLGSARIGECTDQAGWGPVLE